jgi:tetratricopeptide (TPR) repeat protein
MNTIGQVYVKLGLYEAAMPLYEKALQTRREILGEQSIEYAESLNSLALLYSAKYDFTNAEALYRQALTIRRKVLGKEHILESYTALKSKRPQNDRCIEQARKRLFVLYTAWAKPAKAAPYR